MFYFETVERVFLKYLRLGWFYDSFSENVYVLVYFLGLPTISISHKTDNQFYFNNRKTAVGVRMCQLCSILRIIKHIIL